MLKCIAAKSREFIVFAHNCFREGGTIGPKTTTLQQFLSGHSSLGTVGDLYDFCAVVSDNMCLWGINF